MRKNNRSNKSKAQELHGLRACLVCGLVKSVGQFLDEGCNNCEMFLRMRGNKESIYAHTNGRYNCMYILVNSECNCSPGVYAVSVEGHLPPATLHEMQIRGIPYRSRAV